MTQEEFDRQMAEARARGDWAGVAWLATQNPGDPLARFMGYVAPGLSSYVPPSQRQQMMPPSAPAPSGQYYLYPDGNLSNVPGPGALGPFPQVEAANRAAAMKSSTPYTPGSTTTPTTTPPTTKPPTTPQFITPYTKPSGPGAFGERDVNPFAKTRKMF